MLHTPSSDHLGSCTAILSVFPILNLSRDAGFSGYRDRWGANRRQGGFGGAKGGGSGGSSGPPPRHGGGDVPRGEDRYPMGATDDYRPLAERH
jgi:hypothetical protein